MTASEDRFRSLLAEQGVSLAPERAAALARTLEAQLAAERAASRALAFELEPAEFVRLLEGGGA
jgi:hypothetical protein